MKKNPIQTRSLLFRLLAVAIPLTVVPVLLVSFLFYRRYTYDFQNQNKQNVLQTADQIAYNLESYLDELCRLAESPYYNETVMRALETTSENDLEQLEKRRLLESFLNEMMIIPRKDIIGVYILSDEIYYGGRRAVSVSYDPDPTSYDWYRQAQQSNKTVFIPTHLEVLTSDPRYRVFSVAKRINRMSNPDICTGIIKVDANFSGIEQILSSLCFGEDGGILVLDQTGAVIYESRPYSDPQAILATRTDGQRYSFAEVENVDCLLTFTPVEQADWTIVTLHSVNEMNVRAVETRNFTNGVAVLCMLIAIGVIWFVLRNFLRPLYRIVDSMKNIQRGETVCFPEERRDEIGELGRAFNQMTKQIDEMLLEVAEAKQLQNEAQMNVLYHQIQPHFLFNTLNMISLYIRCGKQEQAVDAVDDLSDLLRGMLRMDEVIELRDEIRLLETYLSLQKKRYTDRLWYEIELPPELAAYRLPAFLLQPIVENAVVHGCENNGNPTHIHICVNASGQEMHITVTDDAQGIPEEKLRNIQERLRSAPGEKSGGGIGLYNVDRRIRIHFGSMYGLSIESRDAEGTRVTLCLPLQNPKEP